MSAENRSVLAGPPKCSLVYLAQVDTMSPMTGPLRSRTAPEVHSPAILAAPFMSISVAAYISTGARWPAATSASVVVAFTTASHVSRRPLTMGVAVNPMSPAAPLAGKALDRFPLDMALVDYQQVKAGPELSLFNRLCHCHLYPLAFAPGV